MLDGGSGEDTASYAGSGIGVKIHLSNQTASGGHADGDVLVSIENIIGSASGDYITGNREDNRIEGGAGNDLLKGGAGADFIDGGSGNDTASYSGSGSAVHIDRGADTASGGDADGDVLDNIENLVGSSHDDILAGNAGVNILDGGDGNDELYGGRGEDVLIGGAGDDDLDGDQADDTLIGGAGNDTLDGGYR